MTLAMLSIWSCIRPFICSHTNQRHSIDHSMSSIFHKHRETVQCNKIVKYLLNQSWKMLCTIMSTGVCPIHYLIFLHLPVTFTFTKQDKPVTYVQSLVQLKRSLNKLLFKDPTIWNIIATLIQINPIFK